MKKEIKNKLLLISIIILALALIIILIKDLGPLEKETIKTSFIYSNESGFELGTDNLDFGKLVKNQGAERKITISNDYEFPININIRYSGEITPYIIVSENNFKIEPGQIKEISFSANPGENLTEYRRYSGEIIIITTKA